ncbi:hypothetical protein DSCO28_61980 [Desulfosarcina ovata subsp. sediminis]|uniref:Uncharacterized protein n=1 Tax=Desulfosarcina ovata subsp. sediminis TaxID=885957 RepID=A0A5K7ZZF6_9BACT|nr:hypothetical protein DSCO28_61980 [Desulfosarcina ovata subsp. sediminis]
MPAMSSFSHCLDTVAHATAAVLIGARANTRHTNTDAGPPQAFSPGNIYRHAGSWDHFQSFEFD